jgi:hypothetical protein
VGIWCTARADSVVGEVAMGCGTAWFWHKSGSGDQRIRASLMQASGLLSPAQAPLVDLHLHSHLR